MRNLLGGREVKGILIRDEGILDQLDLLKEKDLSPLENLVAMRLTLGALSANWQEVATLKYVDIFSRKGKRLIETAVGDAFLEYPVDQLESLIVQAATQMKTEPAKTAMFSPSDFDLVAAGRLGMIRVKLSSEQRQLGAKDDDARTDSLFNLSLLLDHD